MRAKYLPVKGSESYRTNSELMNVRKEECRNPFAETR
jgi:hypothetical protein